MSQHVTAESIQVDELFQYAPHIQLPICRECGFGVWPKSVAAHVQRRPHRLGRQDARYVQQVIQQWPQLLQDRQIISAIHQAVQPIIPELPVYTDGWLCEGDSERCRYVCRDEESIKSHFARCYPG